MISFSFSAVARLAVPPGKWFCLARTGLGYAQYSCCVCRMHQEVFEKFWQKFDQVARKSDQQIGLDEIMGSSDQKIGLDEIMGSSDQQIGLDEMPTAARDHEKRLRKTIHESLLELGYHDHLELMESRIWDFVSKRENFLLNEDFLRFASTRNDIVIYTNGPPVMVNMVMANTNIPIYFDKYRNQLDSEIHVGTNESDLILPQTKFLITKKTFPNVKCYPKLTNEVLANMA